jgi:hypothetical protein
VNLNLEFLGIEIPSIFLPSLNTFIRGKFSNPIFLPILLLGLGYYLSLIVRE